ncbi:MAG: hypothetical protein IKC03_00120, partial [Oscillospiraceae bacterium]|nr:hypothetical protein [Oscillospiraceae bacterium]
MIRATTSGTLKSFRANLNTSTLRLNSARNTVLTQRNFNTYAEDPTAAAQSFQLRRTFQQIGAQVDVGESVMRRYDTAYSAIDNVVSTVDNKKSDSAWSAVLAGATDTTGIGRTALGEELIQMSRTIVQSMNSKYGEHYIFSGADGMNIPFTWD